MVPRQCAELGQEGEHRRQRDGPDARNPPEAHGRLRNARMRRDVVVQLATHIAPPRREEGDGLFQVRAHGRRREHLLLLHALPLRDQHLMNLTAARHEQHEIPLHHIGHHVLRRLELRGALREHARIDQVDWDKNFNRGGSTVRHAYRAIAAERAALTAPERDGGHPAARHESLARSAIAS